MTSDASPAPDNGGRSARPQLRDRVIVGVTRAATAGFFRSVEVVGDEPPTGPTILAASHLYGFVDPVVLISRIGHLPRFLAKATLWSNPAAKVALGFARVIPVHRAADGATDANVTMFADAVGALERHGTLAVFAEGTTHDDPTIRPIRTGVARIALQAAGSGVEGVQVVPVGISYEDKVALRGRVLIHYGEPIGVPADPSLLGPDGAPDHDKVRMFTDHLQSRIQDLTPHFDSTEESLALTAAAEMTRRSSPASRDGERPRVVRDVPMAVVADDARRLATTPPTRRDTLVSAVARYRMLCGFVGLDDTTVVGGVDLRALLQRIVVLAAGVIVLAPLAVAGLFANLIPLVAVAVAGLVPKAPVSKGTVRVLVGAIMFPAMWLTLALVDSETGALGDIARSVTLPLNALLGSLPTDRDGVGAAVIVLIGVPVLGVVAAFLIGRVHTLLQAVLRWRTFLDRRGQLDLVRARRDDVVALTRAMLDEAG